MKQQYSVGDIVWFLGRNQQKPYDKEYGVITGIYINIVHVSCFKNSLLDAFFPQTFGTFWGVVGNK